MSVMRTKAWLPRSHAACRYPALAVFASGAEARYSLPRKIQIASHEPYPENRLVRYRS